MTTDDGEKQKYYPEFESLTRRKLLGAVTSTSILGSGCINIEGGATAPSTRSEPNNSSSSQNNEDSNTGPRIKEENETSVTDNHEGDDESINETGEPSSKTSFEVEKPNNFGWDSEESLKEATGYCYPGEKGGYLGALDLEEVESALEEEHLSGEDPNNALNDGELIGALDPLKPVEGLYAVDVDARNGDELKYYVQLVGEQDGGVYLNRQGAYEISQLEWIEVFNEC